MSDRDLSDRYARIRTALAMGPTPGPWGIEMLSPDLQREGYRCAVSRDGAGRWIAKITHEANGGGGAANAAFIAACDPDTIRALLAERDALAAALEAAREDADRIAFLAMEPVIEGFVGVDRDVYDYACDCAEENGRDEPNDEDQINGMRRLIDAAMQRTTAREGER